MMKLGIAVSISRSLAILPALSLAQVPPIAMSMHRFIMKSSLTRPNSIMCYIVFGVGIALAFVFGNPRSIRAAAAFAMSIASVLFFVVHRWQLSVVTRSFAKSIATDPDFRGLSEWYGISRHRDGATYCSGKSGFWVAELLDRGSGTGVIVGCVGLGTHCRISSIINPRS